jgi:hypothetical protein
VSSKSGGRESRRGGPVKQTRMNHPHFIPVKTNHVDIIELVDLCKERLNCAWSISILDLFFTKRKTCPWAVILKLDYLNN